MWWSGCWFLKEIHWRRSNMEIPYRSCQPKGVEITVFTKEVKNILSTNIMRTLYFALMHSHYSYCLLAWRIDSKGARYRSIVLQKRSLCIIDDANYNGHTDPLFTASWILKLIDSYEHPTSLFLSDYITNTLPYHFLVLANLILTYVGRNMIIRYTLLDVHQTWAQFHFHLLLFIMSRYSRVATWNT